MNLMKYPILACVFVALAVCCRRPDAKLYYPCLFLHFLYIPASCLPPFTWSCALLEQFCRNEEFWFMKQAIQHVDCSLLGHTSMLTLMGWLMTMPWLIPSLDQMHFIWFWIFGIIGSWSLLYVQVAGDMVFHSSFADATDLIQRLFILSGTLIIVTCSKYYIEKAQRRLFFDDIQEQDASRKMFGILEYMMPAHVIAPMLADQPIADQVPRVSILFIIISDFDKFTKRLTPSQLLGFLNEQFTSFDEICTANGVTKIETVGEEYVACVGVLPADQKEYHDVGHGPSLVRLFNAAGEILALQTAEVKFKMGIHTGPIVAGVIGTKLPRYRLFGDTINSAARMMQKGIVGKLQFGEGTHDALPDSVKSRVTYRGEVQMKGKGAIKAWNFDPEARRTSVTSTQKFKKVALSAKVAMFAVGKKQDSAKRSGARAFIQDALSIGPQEDASGQSESERRFQDAIKQKHVETDEAKKKRWILSERTGFTDVMEKEWSKWDHIEATCANLSSAFGSKTLFLLLLSGYEIHYMFHFQVYHYAHPLYNRGLRVPVFIYCRLAAIVTNVVWWMWCKAAWIREHPLAAQILMVLSCCTVSALMNMSYDAFVFSDHIAYSTSNPHTEFKAPEDQIFTLTYVLVVFSIMRQHSFRFFISLVFVIFVVVDVYIQDIYCMCFQSASKECAWISVFSFPAKLIFISITLLNSWVAHEDEQTSRARFKAKEGVAWTKKRTQGILDTLMPPLVVEQLSLNPSGPLPSHQYRHATIAQSDLCGFTQLSSTRTPREVVQFMGELFGAFDLLTDKHAVYKVETVGDAYIAGVAERPLTPENSPINVILFGLDMVRAVDDWAGNMGLMGSLTCRVGIHYGECVGGIVGADMQRYHLFGDLMTGLEVLESTSVEGRVQVSKACKDEVERQLKDEGEKVDRREVLSFVERQDDNLKTSKGEIHEYASVGGRTYLIESDHALRRSA